MNPLVARLQQASDTHTQAALTGVSHDHAALDKLTGSLLNIETDIDLVYIALMKAANAEAKDARRAAEDAAHHTGSRRRELETVEHAHRARADRLRYLAKAFQ